MRYWIFIVAIIFSGLLSTQSSGQQVNIRKLDSLFDILSSQNLMMGRISISKEGKEVYQRSFGYRLIDGDKKIVADENTQYRIGSVTKLFTSVMIFQLVEEGKLSLETKLAKFFPQIKNADKITIADMMRHRSGIHSFTDDSLYGSYYQKPQTAEFIINRIAQFSSDFTPDTKSQYSNSNYYLLGCIVEKLDKVSYGVSLKKRITSKLNLKNTSFGETPESNGNIGYPYTMDKKWILSKLTDKSVPVGAGAIVSTPKELNIFLNALFDKKLINEQNVRVDTTVKGEFGMDIYRVPFYENYGWGHGGDIDNFHTDLFKFLKENLTVAVCYNGLNYVTNDVLIGIFSCCLDKPFDLSSFNSATSINVDTTIINRYVGKYASKEIPLKVNVFVAKNKLFAQGDGQSAFPLTAISDKEFIFKQAGINMLFNAEKKSFVLKQGGAEYLFTKE